MKAVQIGESSGTSMDEIMAVYPRHKKVAEEFIAKGVILMPSYVNIGAYIDHGSMVDTWGGGVINEP